MKTILDIMPIPLTQGLYALVDGEDYERLAKYKWRAHKNGYVWYVERSGWCERKAHSTTVKMHREILHTPHYLDTDHANGNGLDNRKQNLRSCTPSQNQHNQHSIRCDNKSGFKGVSWHKATNKWRGTITFNKKAIHIGLFNNRTIAAAAYDQKAKELFGEFARLNGVGNHKHVARYEMEGVR